MKAIFDTNIFIAAFLTEGICSKLLIRARKRQFQLITCPFILQEFEHVLTEKFSTTKKETDEALELISEARHMDVRPAQLIRGVCRHPDDDNILACALAAGAEYLVTGDTDLLELRNFRGIKIVTPRGFELLFND